MNRLISIILLCASMFSDGVLAQQTVNRKVEVTNIDMLIDRYITLEKALWQVVRGGMDRNYVLQRIHDIHLTFFAENFNEKGVYLTDYDENQKILRSAINHVNITTAVVNDVYLHANSEDFKRDQTVGFARYGVNMSQDMDKMYNVTNNTDFFEYIVKKGELQTCMLPVSTIKSTNQLIYDYYTDIAAAQLKAYALAQLSFMFLTVYDVENYVMQAQELQYRFLERNAITHERVRELMTDANREVWMCDPDDPKVKGYSDEITRFIQGYVDNEVNLNPINDCKKTCPDYKLAKNYLCYNGSYCAQENEYEPGTDVKCNGVVLNCDFIGTDMTICPSEDRNRRYKNIKYDCGVTFGSDTECTGVATRATSWTRWFVQCSNCFCYCDEQGPKSDRYFSLRPVLSDTSRNMVITGVALRKHNRIFFWRIMERQLINNAQVNATQQSEWKYGNFFSINEYGVTDGIDYHTLTWQNRSMNMDVLQAPPGKVITGIRFRLDQGVLKLEIRATPFQFHTGQLIDVHTSEWISNTINDRTPINMENLNIPTRTLSKSIPDINANKFIEFGPTDKHLDAGQTTIPFIDTQLVEPHSPVPLSGIGVYYKGQPFYGGFIAPKVITYDYAPHIRSVK